MKPFYILVFIFSFSLGAFAQNEAEIDQCGTDERHAILMHDPEYAAQFAEKQIKVGKYLKEQLGESKSNCTDALYLPIAVHFQDVDIDYGCAVEMALSQIQVLNDDFAGTNSDINKWFQGKSAVWTQINNKKSCIVFCLASINHPNGSGIADGSYAVTLNQYPDDTEHLPQWSGYINLFVRNMSNPLGFSPLSGNGNGDGITCGISYFGTVNCGGNILSTSYNLGRTTTHEMGHYLGLSHPFGTNCDIDNDNIDDTPISDAATYGCPNIGEEIINCTAPVLWPNFMEYCNDACLYMFTKGQVENMDAYVNTSLQHLLNSATITCIEIACSNFKVVAQSTRESCEGNDGTIELTASGGLPPYQYSISGGESFSDNGIFLNLKKNTYQIYVEDAKGCIYTDNVQLSMESPRMDLVASKNAFCGDNSGNITVTVNSDALFKYKIDGTTSWQDTSYFEKLQPGSYDVLAQSENGCESKLRVVIDDDSDLSFIINSVIPVNCPLFDNGRIDLSVAGAQEPLEWTMDNALRSSAGRYENLSPGSYLIEVRDSRGCRIADIFKIGISYLEIGNDCPCEMFIPNAMTPDGDGLNDLFLIVPTCPISEYNLQIFDRLGALIFESDDVNTRWNGAINEYYVEPGVYFYRVAYRWGEKSNKSLKVQVKNGHVSILR